MKNDELRMKNLYPDGILNFSFLVLHYLKIPNSFKKITPIATGAKYLMKKA